METLFSPHHRSPLLPSWTELSQITEKKEFDSQVVRRLKSLKKSVPEKNVRFVRFLGRQITRFVSNPTLRKFNTISWEELVDFFADQVAKNLRFRELKRNLPPGDLKPFYQDTPDFHFNQLPAIRYTVRWRVQKIQQMSLPEDPILILGDDDFVSVELARAGYNNITVLDIDEKIIEQIQSFADSEHLPIRALVHDLNQPPPENLVRDYAVVMFDSINAWEGLKFFMESALRFTDPLSETRFFVTVHLMSLFKPGLESLGVLANEYGLDVESFHPAVNIYPISKRMQRMIRSMMWYAEWIYGYRELRSEECVFPYFIADTTIFKKSQLHS